MALDERLRRELEGAARPADPAGVYEELIRRKERRRVMRRVQQGSLAIVVVVGSALAVVALSHVFSADPSTPGALPGGGRIVYAGPGIPPGPTPANVIGGGAEPLDILIVDPAGGPPTRLTDDAFDDTDPAVSPDGQTVAFCSTREDIPSGGIFLMDVTGGIPTLLTDVAGACYPAWSPDGSRIAFTAGRGDLYVIDVDGTRLQQVTDGRDSDMEPVWSPDGRRLAFHRMFAGSTESDIYLVGVDGSDLERLTDTPGVDQQPSWSPDGSEIVFSTQRFVPDLGSYPGVLAIMDVAGSHATPITPQLDAGVDTHPSWSPDGTLIAFSRLDSADDANEGIYTIRPDGSDLRFVIGDTAPYCCPAPVWQPVIDGMTPSPSLSETPAPTPTARPSPDDRITDVGLGLPLCDVGTVRGTFVEGGEMQTALVGTELTRAGRCPTTQEMTGIAAIDLTGDGVADVASEPFDCEFRCDAHAAPDVDGDGTDELLVLNVGFSVSGVSLFDVVVEGDAVSLVRAMVEPPGDAILGFQGFDGSGPPQFWIGGDAFTADSLRCEPSAGGRVLVSVTAQEVPPDSPGSVWEVHETVFVLETGVLRVIDARDFTVPVDRSSTPGFLGTGGCGADLGGP